MNGTANGEEHKIESDRKWALSVTKENHTNVGVIRIVKAKRYSEELIPENLTGSPIHEAYKQLRNKIFALYVPCNNDYIEMQQKNH